MGRGEVEADEVHQQDAAAKEAGVSVQRGARPRGRSGAGELQRAESVQDPRGSQEHTPHPRPAGGDGAGLRTAYPGRCLLPALLSAVFALCTKDYPC